jgi:hypothetical protein
MQRGRRQAPDGESRGVTQHEPVGVVEEPVADRVGEGGIADEGVPLGDGERLVILWNHGSRSLWLTKGVMVKRVPGWPP